jgi:proline dehydrogenase
MMMACNSTARASPVSPLVYLTFQAYLRRCVPGEVLQSCVLNSLSSSTPARLRQALDHSSSNGYILGAKLVRGAYHSQEVQQHESNPANENVLPLVWSEKGETDQCYNQCAEMLLDQVALPSSPSSSNTSPRIGLLFGTHNKDSCDVVMNGLVKRGLVSEEPGNAGVLKVPQWVSGQVQLGQLLGNGFHKLSKGKLLTSAFRDGRQAHQLCFLPAGL